MAQRRRRFYQTIQKQILVWAGTERLRIEYDGEHIHVPPRGGVARLTDEGKPLPNSPYRYASAVSPAGHYIEGTVEITDRFRRTPEGGSEKAFDVALFCGYLERDRQDLIGRGLEIVTDVNDAAAAMDDCIPRWEDSMDDRARRVIVDELERRRKLEEKGNPVLAGSSEADVIWAFEHQKRRGPSAMPRVSTEDLKRAMLGEAPAASEQAETKMAQDDLPPSAEIYAEPATKPALSTEQLVSKAPAGAAPEPAPGAVNVLQMRRTANALGVKLIKKDLEGLLDGDEATIEMVSGRIAEARKEQEAAAPV